MCIHRRPAPPAHHGTHGTQRMAQPLEPTPGRFRVGTRAIGVLAFHVSVVLCVLVVIVGLLISYHRT